MDLTPHILELIRQTSTNLPADVEKYLLSAQGKEARQMLKNIYYLPKEKRRMVQLRRTLCGPF